MHKRRYVLPVTFGALALAAAASVAHDSEWPPAADPHWDGSQVVGDPAPSSPLYLDRIEFTIPNSAPDYFADWISHFHNVPNPQACQGPTSSAKYGGFKTDFAIGDVDNDGIADDIVITMPGEAVFAAEMSIHWGSMTGTLTPLWIWFTPFAQSITDTSGKPDHSLADIANPNWVCLAANRNNPLIWNLAPDGAADDTNEVAFVGLDAKGEYQHLYVLRTNPLVPGGVEVVDSTEGVPLSELYRIEHRLGICKVRNTEFPRDIVMSQHTHGIPYIWSFVDVGGADRLTFQYEGNHFTNPELKAKTHESNWMDVDGDGFDEFMLNGLFDFVDADAAGNAVPTNGTEGVARWSMMVANQPGQPGQNAHADQSFVADWDPLRPGLELLAVTEVGHSGVWVEPPIGAATGVQHTMPLDTLWDADCDCDKVTDDDLISGDLIDEWASTPAADGQTIFAGNWSTARPGLESISAPKHALSALTPDDVVPAGQSNGTGAFARSIHVTADPNDDDFELLAVDGALYHPSVPNGHPYDANNPLLMRSGGPWGEYIHAIDWDGDLATDEILNHPRPDGYVMLFRMGVKGDWGTGPLPPGMPDMATITNGLPPITAEGDDPACGGPLGWWYDYYQGECGTEPTWNWNQGGPGRGSHYYQKLGEVFPNVGQTGAVVVKPYDLPESDHREEFIAISPAAPAAPAAPAKIHVYFNSEPLAPGVIPRPSPHGSLAYRANRQTSPMQPFDLRTGGVAIRRFGIRPTSAGLPSRAVGIPLGGSVQFEAFLEFENGAEVDVTSLVTWKQDPDSGPFLPISASGLVTEVGGVPLSGRFHAEMDLEGNPAYRSEVSYVFATSDATPSVLRAGYLDTWLVNDASQDDRVVKIEAFCAQRNNAAMGVFLQELDGTGTPGGELKDDGIGPDEHAGDGIYSGVVASQATLSPGANLKVIRAMLGPISIVGPPGLPVVSGSDNSDPWPFLAMGAGSTAPPWPSLAPPPALVSEPLAYEAPRIRSLGYRGWGVPGEILLEVELESSPLHPAAAEAVSVYLPGVGYLPMTNQGGGLFTYRVTNVTATGLFLFHVGAGIVDQGQLFASDHAPQLYLHAQPGWDADEPAPSLGFCREPIGW